MFSDAPCGYLSGYPGDPASFWVPSRYAIYPWDPWVLRMFEAAGAAIADEIDAIDPMERIDALDRDQADMQTDIQKGGRQTNTYADKQALAESARRRVKDAKGKGKDGKGKGAVDPMQLIDELNRDQAHEQTDKQKGGRQTDRYADRQALAKGKGKGKNKGKGLAEAAAPVRVDHE